MSGHAIDNLRLSHCCIERLAFIHETHKNLDTLYVALAMTPFAAFLSANPAEVVASLTLTDWDLLANPLRSVKGLQNSIPLRIIELEQAKHHEGKLMLFWNSMAACYKLDTWAYPTP